MTKEENKLIRLMKLAFQVVIQEDMPLLKELAKR